MLEVTHLKKSYKPKKGVPVTAVNDVSIRFPETGMVFLLGKSGSGKSTLLNLLGGLDRYDSGDIILDNVSTRNFSQSDFDSYRNACLGFIFQEYNVLPEFTVGVNIALAIELQGRKASSEEISKILDEVDLAGYGKRRPNELSGGQLQRVAIARALVKNPKIILADEPTGALDSKTGRQIFELLQKLSETKLVIIVSHDREYSEQFADRIIELADGKIISDVTKTTVTDVAKRPVIENGKCKVPGGYELTAEDREQINAYLSAHPEEKLKIRVDENLTRGFAFATTDENTLTYGEQTFVKTKSRLPLGRAFRVGASSLKSKKVKLVFTVLMSTLAFLLFGLSSTLADYDYTKTVSKVFAENDVKTVYVERQTYYRYGFSEDGYWSDNQKCSEEELTPLYSWDGMKVYPVRNLGNVGINYLGGMEFNDTNGFMDDTVVESSRFIEIDAELLAAFNAELAVGTLPDGSKDEIAISKVTYEMIRNSALLSGKKVPKMADMVGAVYELSNGKKVTVSGIIDTKLDYMGAVSRILALARNEDANKQRGFDLEVAKAMVAAADFTYDMESNLASCIMVGKGFIERQPEQKLFAVEGDYTFGTSATNGRNVTFISQVCFGDLSAVDNFPNYPCAPSKYAEEHGTSCAVNREIAERALRYLLSEENRIFFGINEAAYTAYNREAVKNGQELLVLPDPSTLPEITNFVKNPTMKGFDSGINYAYLSNLSDQELADLLRRVQEYTSITVNWLRRSDNYQQVSITLHVESLISYGRNTADEEEKAEGEFNFEYDDSNDMRYNGRGAYTCVLLAPSAALKELLNLSDAYYCGAMVRLPENRSDVRDFIEYSKNGENGKRFQMITKFNVELDGADLVMKYLHKGLLIAGIIFAVFAALMLTSFIATSIAYKRREVGILRAIGSRGNDVVRIFGSESALIAAICFVLSSLITGILAGLANRYLVTFLHVSLLEFGPLQLLLIAAVAFATAFVATFLPVWHFARKRPIDAIRGR